MGHNYVAGGIASVADAFGDTYLVNALAADPLYLPDYVYNFGLWAPSNAPVGNPGLWSGGNWWGGFGGYGGVPPFGGFGPYAGSGAALGFGGLGGYGGA